MKKLIQDLKKLTSTPAVSGYEWELGMTDVIQQIIGKKGTRIGDNLVYSFGKDKPILFLSAHMDEVGYFKGNGLVPIGDIDMKAVDKNEIEFFGEEGLGQVGTFRKYFDVSDDIVTSTSLDNKVGCLALIETVRFLQKNKPDYTVYCCFSAREEVGTNGVMGAIQKIKPDLCIDIDSAYAKPDGKKNKSWLIPKLGRGIAIQLQGTKFIVQSEWRRKVEKICKYTNIPFQYEIPDGENGGTNASSIQNNGFAVMQLNIPVRFQHTQKSQVSFKDIQSMIRLLETIVSQNVIK